VCYVHQYQLVGGGLDLKLGNELQFKCDEEQNTFGSHASKVNVWNYAETVKRNIEDQKSTLSHFRPKVEIERANSEESFVMRAP
jgi:hypothetical protein